MVGAANITSLKLQTYFLGNIPDRVVVERIKAKASMAAQHAAGLSALWCSQTRWPRSEAPRRTPLPRRGRTTPMACASSRCTPR